MGRQLDGGAELRFDANTVRNRQEIPGALTRGELRDDPRQAHPASRLQEEAREYEFGRGALSLSLPLGGATRLAWLGQVHVQDLWHPLAFGIIDNETWNGFTELRLTSERSAFGLEHALASGVQVAFTQQPQQIHVNSLGSRGPTFSDQVGEVGNLTFYAVDEVALGPTLSLVGGARVQLTRREVDDRIADDSDQRSDVFVTPALGLVWRFAGEVVLYAGAGRIVEPGGPRPSTPPSTTWRSGTRSAT